MIGDGIGVGVRYKDILYYIEVNLVFNEPNQLRKRVIMDFVAKRYGQHSSIYLFIFWSYDPWGVEQINIHLLRKHDVDSEGTRVKTAYVEGRTFLAERSK